MSYVISRESGNVNGARDRNNHTLKILQVPQGDRAHSRALQTFPGVPIMFRDAERLAFHEAHVSVN